jgi:hypothetical protein
VEFGENERIERPEEIGLARWFCAIGKEQVPVAREKGWWIKNASIAYTIRLVTHNHTLSRLITCSLEPRNLKTMYLAVPHFNVNNNNRSANPPYFHYSEIENSNIVVPMQVDDLPTTDVMSMVHKPTSVTISDNDSDAVTESQHRIRWFLHLLGSPTFAPGTGAPQSLPCAGAQCPVRTKR